MAQTDIVLREGRATPADVTLYALPSAPVVRTDIYLCPAPEQPPVVAPRIDIVLYEGEASATDIRLRAVSAPAVDRRVSITLRVPPDGCGGSLTRTFVLGATEAQDAAAFAVTVTTSGAAIDLALAAVESPDVAAFAAVVGSEPPARGTIIGGFGPYPQPAATPEWLGTLPRKAARKVERLARRVRAGALAHAEATDQLAAALVAGDALRGAQAALDALLLFQVERIAELVRNEEFLRAQQEEQARRQGQRNDNALRVLLLMSLQ